MVTTSRDVGDKLEEYVLSTLPKTTKTKGSGSVHGDGDVHQGTEFMVECKTKLTLMGISFSRMEVLKARQQALKLNRSPLFVLKNVSGLWAALPYDKLVSLLSQLVLRCHRCCCEDMVYVNTLSDEDEVSYDVYFCQECQYHQRVY
jgi:hypothetical protein